MIRSWGRNRKGFTITEIVITVAIVGTVSAVAVPGFMRMRMDTNMELVKQNMKAIGEKMQEIYTNKGQYPDESRWPLTGTTDPDEMVITSGLSAVDAKGYTTNEYSRSTPATYQFCSSPKSNTYGTKRFCVHADPQMSTLFAPGQVGEVAATPIDMSQWNGSGVNMLYDGNVWPTSYANPNDPGYRALSSFFAASPSNASTLLTNTLARNALRESANEQARIQNGTWQMGQQYSLRLIFSGDEASTYDRLMSQAYKNLDSMGIHAHQVERSTSYALSNCGPSYTCDLDRAQINANSNPKIYDVSFTLDNPVNGYSDLFERQMSVQGQGFEDWASSH